MHTAFALVARQTGKQQLARVFHKIFSHIFVGSGFFSAIPANRFRVVGLAGFMPGNPHRNRSFFVVLYVTGLF
jgi:hypothetical protein